MRHRARKRDWCTEANCVAELGLRRACWLRLGGAHIRTADASVAGSLAPAAGVQFQRAIHDCEQLVDLVEGLVQPEFERCQPGIAGGQVLAGEQDRGQQWVSLFELGGQEVARSHRQSQIDEGNLEPPLDSAVQRRLAVCYDVDLVLILEHPGKDAGYLRVVVDQ